MKTQYELILSALRRAGRKGCTINDLKLFSNHCWKRIAEMTTLGGYLLPHHGGRQTANFELLDRIEKRIDRLSGRPHPELSKEDANTRRQKNTLTFLMMWTAAIRQAVALCQVRLPDDEL